MLRTRIKFKIRSFFREADIEVSNGEKYLLRINSFSRMEFEIANYNKNEVFCSNRISSGLFWFRNEVLNDGNLIFRVCTKMPGIYIEKDSQRFRLKGFMRKRFLEEFGFISRRVFSFIGINFRTEYPEEFEKEGLVLTALVYMMWKGS